MFFIVEIFFYFLSVMWYVPYDKDEMKLWNLERLENWKIMVCLSVKIEAPTWHSFLRSWHDPNPRIMSFFSKLKNIITGAGDGGKSELWDASFMIVLINIIISEHVIHRWPSIRFAAAWIDCLIIECLPLKGSRYGGFVSCPDFLYLNLRQIVRHFLDHFPIFPFS